MIRPPGFRGAAFTTAKDGHMRGPGRSIVSKTLGIDDAWATAHQVHGTTIHIVDGPGRLGEGDGLVTVTKGLPIAAFAADCLPVILEADNGVGVAHAGWRGVVAGVVPEAVATLTAAASSPRRAAIGPGIGPCCFEVGNEVAQQFPDDVTTTTWGTTSVDLVAAVRRQLGDVDTWTADACTLCGDGFFSYRKDATTERMAGVGWLP